MGVARHPKRPERLYPGRQPQALGRLEGRLNVIGERLREARLSHDPPWTIEELSHALAQVTNLELSPATISKIERGKRGAYDYEVVAFCKALAVTPHWLLSWE